MKKYLDKLKLKKGASMIEFVNVMLVFLILFVVSLELFFIGYKYISIGSFANSLTQAVSIQGGIQPSSPKGYETANVTYLKTSDILKTIDDLSKSLGQDSSSITVKIRYQKTASNGAVSYNTTTLKSGTNVKIDYGNWFEITVECNLKSMVVGDLIPLNIGNLNITRTKGGVSQFEHGYDLV